MRIMCLRDCDLKNGTQIMGQCFTKGKIYFLINEGEGDRASVKDDLGNKNHMIGYIRGGKVVGDGDGWFERTFVNI